jgi:hypothetical protein
MSLVRERLVSALAVTLFIVCSTASADYVTTVLADDPEGYWQLGETSGTTAVDLGSGAHNGNYDYFGWGPPTLGVAGILGASGNTAVQFDGVSNEVYIASTFSPASTYSIEAWVKADEGATTNRTIMLKTWANETPLTGGSHELWITPEGHFQHYTWTGYQSYVTGTTTVEADQWYHVVGVFASGTGTGLMGLYVNGVEEYMWTGTVPDAWNAGGAWRIGSEFAVGHPSHPGFFGGTIDEVAVYDHVLSASEVLAHYNAGIVPEPSSLAVLTAGLVACTWRRRR